MNLPLLKARLKALVLPIVRVPSILRAKVYLAGCQVGRRVRLLGLGRLRVVREGRIIIGEWAWFNQGPLCTELVCEPDGEITIGDRTGFNYGVSLRARRSIRIGCDSMFGAMAMVRDFDGWRTAPVVIGDRVWLGHGAIIEPGVTIGDDSVISAGSVVLEDVPPRMIAVGNPARCLPLQALRRPSNPRPAGAPSIPSKG